ncbi:MAG: FtsB family cell division protein [Panacagrimonas sp.]
MLRYGAIAILGLTLLGLQARLWVSDDGVSSLRELQQALLSAQAENQQLAVRNKELRAEVEDLKSGRAAIEARARTQLGMIRPAETFFLVVQ